MIRASIVLLAFTSLMVSIPLAVQNHGDMSYWAMGFVSFVIVVAIFWEANK